MTTVSTDFLGLKFDHRFIDNLPADQETANHVRQVRNACYSFVTPQRPSSPKLVAWSREMAEELGLSPETINSPEMLGFLSGSSVPASIRPYAMCYGGYQFGSWASQLGDGRAINLAECLTPGGKHLTLQLKGGGPTPYSRQGDGYAVLRSSIREFLCSEAMYHLGIPTIRALSLVTTGDTVIRDMFYDGHPEAEPGAIVCRVSPSFLRFGNFEIHARRGELDLLKKLADYTIENHFPWLGVPSPSVYTDWFREICHRTATTIIHWMRVGFVHGVMNTDNMSILGLTIDYGPYGWLEGFDADWTPNTTDAHSRRYTFGNQPHIGQWNLAQLASALLPLVGDSGPLEECLKEYNRCFLDGWNRMMAAKIGISSFSDTDDRLIGELVELLQLVEVDMTIFFQTLADLEWSTAEDAPLAASQRMVAKSCYDPEAEKTISFFTPRLANWLSTWNQRLSSASDTPGERRSLMNRTNPRYILRNYLAQLAIDDAENGNYALLEKLLEMARKPYERREEMEEFFVLRPEWARNRAGCSMLSCSS